MKTTTRRQRKLMKKFSDPSSSLLEERWQYQRRFYIWLIVITNILAFFSGFVFLIVYYQVKRAYLYAKELYDEGNEKKLLEYVKHGGTWGYQTTGSFGRFFSIYALVDMKNIEIARVLRDRLHELRFYSKLMQRPYQYPLEVLAIKLDYATPEQLISRLDGLEETPVEEKIPIIKVYFVKKIPKGTQCMVSSLPLDIDEDDIVACPFCGNMAQREHLSNWLATYNHCPVCRRVIKIVDCPIVKIS